MGGPSGASEGQGDGAMSNVVHQLVHVEKVGQTLTPDASSPRDSNIFRYFCSCGTSWTREDMMVLHVKDQNR